MAKLKIEVGMRVVYRLRQEGHEGTVVKTASRYSEEAGLAKVRHDSWWRGTDWVDADYLYPIDGAEKSHVG